jgi:hypothetical protein
MAVAIDEARAKDGTLIAKRFHNRFLSSMLAFIITKMKGLDQTFLVLADV